MHTVIPKPIPKGSVLTTCALYISTWDNHDIYIFLPFILHPIDMQKNNFGFLVHVHLHKGFQHDQCNIWPTSTWQSVAYPGQMSLFSKHIFISLYAVIPGSFFLAILVCYGLCILIHFYHSRHIFYAIELFNDEELLKTLPWEIWISINSWGDYLRWDVMQVVKISEIGIDKARGDGIRATCMSQIWFLFQKDVLPWFKKMMMEQGLLVLRRIVAFALEEQAKERVYHIFRWVLVQNKVSIGSESVGSYMQEELETRHSKCLAVS